MEQHPLHRPEAATDEPAFPATRNLPANDPDFASLAEEDAYWAGVTAGIRAVGGSVLPGEGEPVPPRSPMQARADSFHPGRRVRHDGWTGEKKARFLEVLAASGVVADACRAVGMSVQSAHSLRNRRSGRSWGAAWDAVLIHRARSRLSDDVLGRAINGCTDQVVRGGVVVAERRRHDNRLAMAVLARLDRLAERKEGAEAIMLQRVSEDFEDLLDCFEAGDEAEADAFVELRTPRPPDELDRMAHMLGIGNRRDEPWYEIDVSDLDPDEKSSWTLDGWIRAERSLYLQWLDMAERSGTRPAGRGCPAQFDRLREAYIERLEAEEEGEEEVGDEDEGEEEEERNGFSLQLLQLRSAAAARKLQLHQLHPSMTGGGRPALRAMKRPASASRPPATASVDQ